MLVHEEGEEPRVVAFLHFSRFCKFLSLSRERERGRGRERERESRYKSNRAEKACKYFDRKLDVTPVVFVEETHWQLFYLRIVKKLIVVLSDRQTERNRVKKIKRKEEKKHWLKARLLN